MMTIRACVRVHIALGVTDMRKGLDGLTMLVQEVLRQDPFSGHLFAFRGRKANLIKIGTAQDCACSASGWRTGTFRGPAPTNRETRWH